MLPCCVALSAAMRHILPPVKFVLQNAHVLGRSEVARMPVPGRVEALSFAVVVSAVDPVL